jgi:tetratricopeptide (TPR) repeat protein
MTRIEERLDLALTLKDEKIQSISDRSENIYKLFQLVGVFAAVALFFFSIRDIVFRWREGQRQRSIDDIVKETMNLQKSATQQQLQFGELHLTEAKTNLRQQGEGLQNVNQVIEVVRQTLAFRLEQEEKVAKTIGEIERMKTERDRAKKQKFAHAVAILDHLNKMSRMQFASLTDEQYKRGIRLQGLVNELEEFLVDQDFEVAGRLLYTCGVIAYYDNDVIEAKAYLDRAAQCRAPDHEGELGTNPNYRKRFGFTHYFRALIYKNWGDLSEAQHEIEQGVKLLEEAGEFLTPVTKAEVLSYIVGDEDRCQAELQSLLRRTDDLEAALKNKGESLDANQARLRNRMLVLSGNTHFVRKNGLGEALVQYTKAIGFNSNDYYALTSAAQCERALGDEHAAASHFRECLDAIERSGDIRRKRERITRAVIAVTAANAAKGCGDEVRREQWTREARELLSGNLAVDGMSPKFFSPSTKRLIGAAELLKELDSQ